MRNFSDMLSQLLLLIIAKRILSQEGKIAVVSEFELDCTTPLESAQDGVNLDTALSILATNGSVQCIRLAEGCHTVTSFHLISQRVGISIVGVGEENVIVTCEDNLGLAFLNVTTLKIANVTIRNCGLQYENLTEVLSTTVKSVSMPYQLPPQLKVAVYIGYCTNLSLSTVRITQTRGIGILAINLMGSSQMNNVTYSNNTPSNCSVESAVDFAPNIAAGLLLLYSDFSFSVVETTGAILRMQDCQFVGNQDCSSLGEIIALSSQIGTTPSSEEMALGSLGSFGIKLSQTQFPVQVDIKSTIFWHNLGYFGSAVHIDHFQRVANSSISFSNCIFEKNGFGFDDFEFERYSYGGAVAILLNLYHPTLLNLSSCETSSNTFTSITFQGSQFIENQALVSAGIFLFIKDDFVNVASNRHLQVELDGCLFERNMATGSSAFGVESDCLGPVSNTLVLSKDSLFFENGVGEIPIAISQNLTSSIPLSTVGLESINSSFSGSNVFKNNLNSAIQAARSIINVVDSLVFTNNSAVSGGAIQLLDDSSIVVHNNSVIRFTGNIASLKGGAIYAEVHGTEEIFSLVSVNCFLYFEAIDVTCQITDSCIDPTQLNVSITFSGNIASLGGSIYGSSLRQCSWMAPLLTMYKLLPSSDSSEDILKVLNVLPFLSFQPPLNGTKEIATNPFALTVTNSTLSVKPGQNVSLNVVALDTIEQSVPLVITSMVVMPKNSSGFSSSLGLSGYWFLPGENPNPQTRATFYGPENSESVVQLYAVNTLGDARTFLTVTLEECGLGLTLSNYMCICAPELASFDGVQCTNGTFTIMIPANKWLGNGSHGEYVYANCILDYCQDENVTLVNGNVSAQCAKEFNREGLLCSQCVSNYSLVFGSNKCAVCSNYWLFLIIPLGLAGILLVILIAFLGFTITRGYLNSMLFYCNTITFFVPFFSPGSNQDGSFVVIEMLNLNVGKDLCFYHGMNALARTGLQLVFPAYLFILMGLIILSAQLPMQKLVLFLSKSGLKFDAPGTFATLLLLCYTSVARTCVEMLAFVVLSEGNNTYVRWYIDPTVEYGHGWHGFYIAVALLLLLFYIFPFGVILTMPSVVLKSRLGFALKPIWDSFWHPFKPQFRFWIGFRALVRFVPLLMALFIPYPLNCFFLGLFASAGLITLEYVQPFQENLQNHFEHIFLVDILLLSFTSFLYQSQESGTKEQTLSLALLYIFLILGYCAIAMVFAIHLYLIFGTKIKEIIAKLHKKKLLNNDQLSNENEETECCTRPTFTTTFVELREPQLDDGEADCESL